MVFIGYALIALIVAGLLFYAVVALLPGGLTMKPQSDRRPFELPADRRMVADDLAAVRIPVALRGYRFAETDDLIDRLAAEIVVRDEEIARLRRLARSEPEAPSRAHRPRVDLPDFADRVDRDRALPEPESDPEHQAHPADRAEHLGDADHRDA